MGDCGLYCTLYDGGQETLQHLLFDCENAKQVLRVVFSFLDHIWQAMTWEEDIKVMAIAKINKRRTNTAKLIVIRWKEIIYRIWMQRNQKFFAETSP